MAVFKLEKLFFCTVIFTFGFNILTVTALFCHQCNSLMDIHCDTLKIHKNSKNFTEKYLKECPQSMTTDSAEHQDIFCRKTTYYINYEDSLRVVRSCGWKRDTSIHKRKTCINADNEGYMESICICDTDGCNSAPITFIGSKFMYFTCLIFVYFTFRTFKF